MRSAFCSLELSDGTTVLYELYGLQIGPGNVSYSVIKINGILIQQIQQLEAKSLNLHESKFYCNYQNCLNKNNVNCKLFTLNLCQYEYISDVQYITLQCVNSTQAYWGRFKLFHLWQGRSHEEEHLHCMSVNELWLYRSPSSTSQRYNT